MKKSTNFRIIRPLGLVILLTFLAQVSTGQVKRGMTGDWQLQIDVDGQQLPAILSFSRNDGGTIKGEWLSFWGITPLREIKYENKQLTFAMTIRLDEGDTDTTFSGSVNGGELSGIFTNSIGEYPCRGKRIKRISRAAGTWQTNLTLGDWEFTADIIIKVDAQGKLSADWKSRYGAISIEKVHLDDEGVTFKTTLEIDNQKYDISFTSQITGRKIVGEITSPLGTAEVTGEKRRLTRAGRQNPPITKTPREPDVIYVPTPQQVVDKMLELAQITKDDLLYDLGCGDGRIVVTAAKKYGCKAAGFDLRCGRVKASLENVKKNNVGHLVRIEQKDIFTLDLSKANVITLYLLPELNVKLIPQLEKLEPGSRIVSHDFDMKGVKPDKVVTIEDEEDDYGDHTIYLWTTLLKKEDVNDE